MSCKGTVCRHCRAGPGGQPSLACSAALLSNIAVLSSLAQLSLGPPDWSTAPPSSGASSPDRVWCAAATAPASTPPTVTRVGSPPNPMMFCNRQRITTARWKMDDDSLQFEKAKSNSQSALPTDFISDP